MTTYGPFYPTSVASNNSSGGVAWVNPGNAIAEDGAVASSLLSGSQASQWLVASGFDLSSIPDTDTPSGVLVEWKKRRFLPFVCDDLASRLVKAGAIGTADRSVAGHWPVGTSAAWVAAGGTGDTWDGVSVADLKATGFGAAIRAHETAEDSRGNALVDCCRITIYTE